MEKENSSLSIVPMTDYTPPSLPNLQSAKANPVLLKKLPSRWQKNATVIACIGVIGGMTLASCMNRPHHGGAGDAPIYVTYRTEAEATPTPAPTPEPIIDDWWCHYGGSGGIPFYVVYPTEQEIRQDLFDEMPEMSEELVAMLSEAELEMRSHYGGAGEGPFYVVSITEHEVMSFIQAKLEEAGLDLSSTPPEHTVFDPEWGREHGLDLFDSNRNVAVALLSATHSFHEGGRHTAMWMARDFARQMWDTSVGVFHNPFMVVGWGNWVQDGDDWVEEPFEATDETKEDARDELIESITTQVRNFIYWLQWEGIVRGW
ncbi:MAG: hypothetical protein FWC73_06110 [Defluviitaleaceae bacterium]|nr:hypothetical protein [Defluviitaleaceae bacterium]